MPPAQAPRRYPELLDADRYHLTRRGWVPRTNFPELEEMRERHEALVEQRDGVQAEWGALQESFEAEDRTHAEALAAVYREGREPDEGQRTSEEDRRRALEEAGARSTAASRVVLDYALDVLDRLRGPLPEDWQPHIAVQTLKVPPDGEAAKILATISDEERALAEVIAEARRTIEAAGLKLREYHPLKVWLARNGNASTAQVMPGNDLQVPPTHTAGTKPRDLDVPGWWNDEVSGEGQHLPIPDALPEGHEHLPADADAEEGAPVDLSDPWFAERDATDPTKEL